MKQFTFSLQKILNLRRHNEDEAKLNLGRAVGVLTELENRIFDLVREQARAATDQFNPGNSTATMHQYMLYLQRLEGSKERLFKEAAQAELEVDEAREAFIEASRERKVLDKLKEKRQKEYRDSVFAEEAKALDDIRKMGD